jgi:hypothetical protein
MMVEMNKKITLIFCFLIIVTPGGVFSAPQSLTKCKVQSKTVYLQKTSKPLRISGIVLSKGTNEYHLRVQSDLKADVQLTTSDSLKLDVYSLDPPTVIQKRVDKWSGDFYANKEYVLAINNCSGAKPAKFQILVSPH